MNKRIRDEILSSHRSVSPASNLDEIVEQVWHDQVQGWEAGSVKPAEGYFDRYPTLLREKQFAIDVVFNEFALRSKLAHSKPEPEEFYNRFPELMPSLQKQLDLFLALDEQLESPELDLDETIKLVDDSTVDEVVEPADVDEILRSEIALPARYQVRRELGSGASSKVYEAWDDELKQAVAIKKPHASTQNSSHARKRLIQEARSISKLHHPRIVSVREISTIPNQLYLVSPLIKGESLADRMSKSKPTVDQSVQWIIQLAGALHYAHENGVIHRDVKPGNIIVDASGQPVLTDFGLATNQDLQHSITGTGDLVGTPAYMSPEQILSPSDTGPSTDIYSLGVTLYQLLTGRLPFEGSFSKVIHQVLEQPAPALRRIDENVPHELQAIVSKCLQKEVDQRYATARDFADDLRRFQNDEPVQASADRFHQTVLKLVRRHPMASLAITSIACLALFLLGTLWQLNQVARQRDRAVTAENQNQRLLAIASIDAADLSRQQGEFDDAIGNYRQSLAIHDDDLSVRFKLVECLVAVGKVDQANAELASIENKLGNQLDLESLDREGLQATIQYWRWELSALGESSDELLSFDSNRLGHLTLAQREFVEGMRAQESSVAADHFQAATKADPYHHGARRMSMIMNLSLARYDEVIDQASSARLLYPNDQDMVLMEALARAGKDELAKAETLVRELPLTDDENQRWLELCKFINYLARPMSVEENMPTNLETATELTTTFFRDHLDLLKDRNWRFPPAIGDLFVDLPLLFEESSDLQSKLEIARALAEAHSEGSITTVAAEMELTVANGQASIDNLERSLAWYLKALECNSFLDGHQENSWLGVYGNCVALALVHKHEVEANKFLYVDACKKLDPKSPRLKPFYRVVTISLIHTNEWSMAGEYSKIWFESCEDDAERLDALWHKAVARKHFKKWADVLECCRQAEEIIARFETDPKIHDWTGLSNHAVSQLQKLVEMKTKDEK